MLLIVVPLAQLFELALSVAAVQELVLNSWRRVLLDRRLDPILLNLMVGLVVCATKEYQTSADVVAPPQKALMPGVAVAVAAPFLKLPGVVTHAVPDTRVATPQASFVGWANAGNEVSNNMAGKQSPLIKDLTNLTGFIEWA